MTRRMLGLAIALLGIGTTGRGENLLINPGFEAGAENWSLSGEVGPEWWAARSGFTGMCFRGWTDGSPGNIQQVVSITQTGTYSFSLWVRMESNNLSSFNQLRMDWWNAFSNNVKARDSYTFTSIAKDAGWHRVNVTGACTNTDLRYIRVSTYSAWAQSGDASGLSFDDAELVAGAPSPPSGLANPFFAEGNGATWAGSSWNAAPNNYGNGREAWGDTGEVVGVFYGGMTNDLRYASRISQNLQPGTGTYTWGLTLLCEPNMWITNTQLSIEWYDTTFSNMVQSPSATNLLLPNDNQWHTYYVSGTCADESLTEVRCVLSAQWNRNTNQVAGRAAKFTQAVFARGRYDDIPFRTEWAYHNGSGYSATEESVPGGYGRFLHIDYATRTNTCRLLADSPFIGHYPETEVTVGLRTAWLLETATITNWIIDYHPMVKEGTVEISASTPFHGHPSTGTATVDIWRCQWPQPATPEGHPTNVVVFYAPVLQTPSGLGVSNLYLVSAEAVFTNTLGQPVSTNYYGDYTYWNNYANPDLDGDGLPNDWEDARGLLKNVWDDVTSDNDFDGSTLWEEYLADTDPENDASFFLNRIEECITPAPGLMRIQIGPPTTNSRLYDVHYATNLCGVLSWTSCGFRQTGNTDGSALLVTITNSGTFRVRATSVGIP